MVALKYTILIALLSLLVLFVGIGYVDKVRKCNQLEELISMENILIDNGMKIDFNISNEEFAMKLCEREIQEKRAYIDQCINEFQKRNLTQQKDENNTEGLQQILRIGQERLDECFEERNELKSTYKNCYPKVSDEDTNIFRNGSLVNKIKNFIVFLGYPRSGASIVGALLDAHPHVVISNEFNPVLRWTKSQSGAANKFDKFELFGNIMNAAWSAIHAKGGTRNENITVKYYTLDIPGLYQGEYEDYIQVIGDKQDNQLIDYDKGVDGSKNFIQMLERFKDFVGHQVKFFHIVRNPYDNIATVLLYRLSSRNQVIKSGTTIKRTDILVSVVKKLFVLYEKIQRYIDYFGERVLTLNHEDLISKPVLFITRMCNHMEIYCGEYYLEKASKSVFSSATKSRHSVEWEQDVKTMIESAIQKYTFLNRYTFEN